MQCARREELLQRENLAAIAQRIPGEQPQLRERVEHQARRLRPLDVGENPLRRFAELDLGRVKHRVLLIGLELGLRRSQLADRHARAIPAVGVRDGAQLFFGLGKRHVEHGLAELRARQQELHRERRLAGTRHTFDEVQAVGGKTAGHDVV